MLCWAGVEWNVQTHAMLGLPPIDSRGWSRMSIHTHTILQQKLYMVNSDTCACDKITYMWRRQQCRTTYACSMLLIIVSAPVPRSYFSKLQLVLPHLCYHMFHWSGRIYRSMWHAVKVVLLSAQSLKLEPANDTSVWVSLSTTKTIMYAHISIMHMALNWRWAGLGNTVVLESGCFMTCTLGWST